jgi:hypothetical protein
VKPMYGIQEVLRHSLLEINNRCQSLRQDIVAFVNSVSTLPASMVKISLSVMSINIGMQASRLHNRHDGKGGVFVMMTDTVLSVQWAEKELSIEDKENFKMAGYLTLSLEEIATVVKHLAEGVDSGQFAEAVEWINRYEQFLAFNAKKLL